MTIRLNELGEVAFADGYRDMLLPPDAALRRFTAFITWDALDPNGIEEIDVDAIGPGHARLITEAALARDYEPGGKIVGLEERHGLYL